MVMTGLEILPAIWVMYGINTVILKIPNKSRCLLKDIQVDDAFKKEKTRLKGLQIQCSQLELTAGTLIPSHSELVQQLTAIAQQLDDLTRQIEKGSVRALKRIMFWIQPKDINESLDTIQSSLYSCAKTISLISGSAPNNGGPSCTTSHNIPTQRRHVHAHSENHRPGDSAPTQGMHNTVNDAHSAPENYQPVRDEAVGDRAGLRTKWDQNEWDQNERDPYERDPYERYRYERYRYERDLYEWDRYERDRYERDRYEQDRYERDRYERDRYEQDRYERDRYERDRYERDQYERHIYEWYEPRYSPSTGSVYYQ